MSFEDPDESYEVIEWPKERESSSGHTGEEPVGEPPVQRINVQVTSKYGIIQSFLIMDGDSIQLQLEAIVEGLGATGAVRIGTIPITIRVRLS